jgi:hypothetical protein
MAYERDILDEPRRPTVRYPEVPATAGLVVEDRGSGFCGDVVETSTVAVTLRDRHGHVRHFRWKPGGFLLDGRPVTLVPPPRSVTPGGVRTTASGSLAAAPAPARTARADRIWVEGVHDAELLELVWGDDLRELAVVVEPLGGIDQLARAVERFGPGPDRRLGVLVDHLVPGSKETRLAAEVRSPWVLITGHPFVDVWAAIRPHVVGLRAWPEVPRHLDWKQGVAEAIGDRDPATLWRRLRGRVRSYADLDPSLVGAVERLLDFVATPGDR